MKIVKLIVLLAFFFNIAKGQIPKAVNIRLVKEKPSIDSMIKQFQFYNTKNNIEDQFKFDHYIIISIYAKHGDALFSVHFIDSVYRKNLYTYSADIFKKKNLRYFKFENNFVLVYGDDESYNLFEPTSKSSYFNIVVIEKKEGAKPRDGGYLYTYKNGVFKILGDLSR